MISALIAVCLFAITCVLTVTGANQSLGAGFTAWLQGLQTPWLTTTMIAITTSGEWYVLAAICVVLLVIPRTRLSFGVPISAATLAAGIANEVLKNIFREPRPDAHRLIVESGFSFPSGHAMSASAMACMAVFLLLPRLKSSLAKVLITAAIALVTLLIGVSRIYLGVHYPIDIVGGYLATFALFVLTVWLLRWFHAWLVNRRNVDSV